MFEVACEYDRLLHGCIQAPLYIAFNGFKTMNLFNRSDRFGLISIILHWILALMIVGMVLLGQYMVDLGYYDAWYHRAPWWHKGIGVTVFVLVLLRLVVKVASKRVMPLSSHRRWEVVISTILHYLLYFLLILTCCSGYFVATAKGVSIEVFSWFEFPAIMTLTEAQTDFFGDVHEVSTNGLIVLFLFHVAAVAKHSFVDKDATLTRMLGRK